MSGNSSPDDLNVPGSRCIKECDFQSIIVTPQGIAMAVATIDCGEWRPSTRLKFQCPRMNLSPATSTFESPCENVESDRDGILFREIHTRSAMAGMRAHHVSYHFSRS